MPDEKMPTPAQRKVLQFMANNSGAYCTYSAIYHNGFGHSVSAATIGALDRAKWIAPMIGRTCAFTITPAGRAAISDKES